MTEPNIWKERQKTLDAQLQDMSAELAKDTWKLLPRRETILKLITNLTAFAQGYADYFIAAFDEGELNESSVFPPPYVKRQVINRITEDVFVIQSCLSNRLLSLTSPAIAETLLTDDKLAYQALKPPINAGWLPPETTAISYYQKNMSVRVIPYASVALIGIPMTCTVNPIDLLAVPHEVGHYVYWNSKQTEGEPNFRVLLHKIVGGEPRWFRAWVEEIFADVYGALVAKGTIARSFQDLEYESAKSEFGFDDGDHPIPAIRPEIYSYVIEKIGNHQPLVDSLKATWEERRQKRGTNNAFVIVNGTTAQNSVQVLEEVRNELKGLINDIFDILNPRFTNFNFPGRDGEGTYEEFSNSLPNSLATYPAPPDSGISATTFGDWVASLAGDMSAKPTVDSWLRILCADGGWTTEGPHSRLIDPP